MPGVLAEPCPLCDRADARPVHARPFAGRRWELARCRGCGLHFTAPTPTPADLGRFYAGDYHAGLRRPGAAEAAFGAKYRRYADALGRHLRSGRVVDVGCSTGLLVRLLRDRGYDAEGVELNAASAAWGREHYGVPIHAEALEGGRYAPGSLDAVLLTDVLEHTPHPAEFLRGVGRLLAPGGLVFVTFPDIGSAESRYQFVLSKVLRRGWLWATCHVPLHVWEFTRRSAESTFAAAGFGVAEFRRHHPRRPLPDGPLLKLLSLPTRPLGWPAVRRLLGTQMEFVLRKAG
jgi:2-polyprenyl-3-methyl-5-hydroxy-6-metoxy-1,4-benzoquinol methylase